MTRRAIESSISALLVGMFLIVSPALVTDVHAPPAAAFTCIVHADPGTHVVMPCGPPPGLTTCKVSKTDAMKVVAAGASFGTGKVSCIKNVGGPITASAGFDRSCNMLCSGMCPSDTTCSLALPPPFEGQEGTCEATGGPLLGSTSTCTIYWK